MEFFTGALLSGIVYDMFKYQIILSAENLKDKLKDWIIDDKALSKIANELNELQLSDELSETAIEKRIMNSNTLASLIENIKPISENNVTQIHYGTGDNVGRDKIEK